MLSTRVEKSSYTDGTVHVKADSTLLIGPIAQESLSLEAAATAYNQLVSLFVDASGDQNSEATLRGHLESDDDDESVLITCVKWIVLPGRTSSRGKLWAERQTKGYAHYSLDVDLDMNAPAVTSDIVIVQLQHLFVIPSRLGEAEESHIFACVFYGKRDGVDTRTQCPFYSFGADAN